MEKNEAFQKAFDEHFCQYKDRPVALYGTGKNAELIVKYARGYDFFALVSADLVGRTAYGKKVIAIEEAVKKARVLIIAAGPASTGIVYARIKSRIPADIPVYDMRGQRLNIGEYYRNNPYWDQSMTELYRLVDVHDTISFDIFDTLLARRVSRPTDIFSVTEDRLRRQGREIPFVSWRMASEKEAGKGHCPTFEQIYETMQYLYGPDREEIEESRQIEILTELEFLSCRRTIKELLFYACRKGKSIYLTSDMYFPEKILRRFLDKCGITCEYTLLVSCEYNVSKADGRLYDVLKRKGKGKILHIGDNYEADVENAAKYGIDTYRVMSGYDLAASSSLSYLMDVSGMSDRIMLGTCLADLLENPFVLNKNRGKMQIRSFHSLAYAFVPVTILFLNFIIEKSRHYDYLLFASRDGFFLNQLYQREKEKHGLQNCAKGMYFYASRQVANRASVLDENDIITVCSKLTEDAGLNVKGFLEMQFQIYIDNGLNVTAGKAVEQWGEEGLWKRVLTYKDRIIERADRERKKYLDYINKMGIERRRRIAVVDIVTQGTLVYGLSRILGTPVDLIALGTSMVPNQYMKDPGRVNSLYGNVNGKAAGDGYSLSDFSDLHLFLEMMYASGEGQFAGFGEKGEIMTQKSEYDCELIAETQKEMTDIIERIPDEGKKDITPSTALSFLRMLYGRHSDMADELKRRFTFCDPYDANKSECNLMEIIG